MTSGLEASYVGSEIGPELKSNKPMATPASTALASSSFGALESFGVARISLIRMLPEPRVSKSVW